MEGELKARRYRVWFTYGDRRTPEIVWAYDAKDAEHQITLKEGRRTGVLNKYFRVCEIEPVDCVEVAQKPN